jgi:hypothetical protein
MGINPAQGQYGDDCLTCFPAGETPLYFKIFITGLMTGDLWLPTMGLPPNGYHDLLQSDILPCRWYDVNATYPDILYRAGPTWSEVRVRTVGGHVAFVAGPLAVCKRSFSNLYDSPVGNTFWGGTAHLSTPYLMKKAIERITPLADPSPKLELFGVSDPVCVIRYAGKRDATNVSILLDGPP